MIHYHMQVLPDQITRDMYRMFYWLLLLLQTEVLLCSVILFVLDEELPVNTAVGHMDEVTSATAEDLYDLFPVGEFSRLFRMDGMTLRTAEVIDREEVCPGKQICELGVSVRSRPRFSIRRVVVRLVDSNDFRPSFDRSDFTVDILESTPIGSEFSLDNAVDKDSPANGVIEYTLQGGQHHFRLVQLRNSS